MPPITEGYVPEPEGTCSLTGDITTGPFVRSPYIVTAQYIDRPFYLGAPTITAFATAIGLVEEEPLLEQLDQKDAIIQEQEATIKALQEDISTMKIPAERYWAMIAHEDGTDLEAQILELQKVNAEQKAQLAKFTHKEQKEIAA